MSIASKFVFIYLKMGSIPSATLAEYYDTLHCRVNLSRGRHKDDVSIIFFCILAQQSREREILI